MGLVAAGADPDVTRSAEQRAGARLVPQPHRIAAQLGAAEFDSLARIGQQRDDVVRSVLNAGFVAAQEEHAALANGARDLAPEVFLAGLHRSARRRSAIRVTMRSATSFERFSSAVCSAAMVAYSELTTSIPASDPAVASSRISPEPRSTSW